MATRRKVVIDTTLKLDGYAVIARAVEEGCAAGVRHAFKHADTPAHSDIAYACEDAVMSAISELLVRT